MKNLRTQLNLFLVKEDRTLRYIERNTGIHYMKLWRFQNETQKKLNSGDEATLVAFLASEGYGE